MGSLRINSVWSPWTWDITEISQITPIKRGVGVRANNDLAAASGGKGGTAGILDACTARESLRGSHCNPMDARRIELRPNLDQDLGLVTGTKQVVVAGSLPSKRPSMTLPRTDRTIP